MDPGGRAEAERCLAIAEKLLAARDLVGSKRFAERSLEADPLIDGVDQILAVADVLLDSQRRVNNHIDWYAVLQLPSSPDGRDPSAVKLAYRRLALLLHPDRNRSPGADAAFRLVCDAWSVLSDPSKKSLFDAELHIAASAASKPSPFSAAAGDSAATTFWTACTFCCRLHQYARAYLNCSLRCPNCRRAFNAAEITAPPPIVPGTDMYYCSWGFFPLGFPGGPGFGGTPDLSSGWKPFHPMFPRSGNHPSQPPPDNQQGPRNGPSETPQDNERRENAMKPQWTTAPAARNKKKMARKKVGGDLKKRTWNTESEGKGGNEAEPAMLGPEVLEGSRAKAATIDVDEEVEFRDININEAAKGSEGNAEIVGDEGDTMNFHIDMDATDELLGNLQSLPFLKEEEIPGHMP
ncbi:uncharacterized protein LOC103701801 [Phoenix dactylifera]|uniref:Uncharacterized protein LOC103701801 n=1 Tax=Phoenix dactylifera TaxID=42345 RepID=A0A8B7BNM0_PHODC|nr:uncharacterized protein LOC103701801 [Phoenix dactylifera]